MSHDPTQLLNTVSRLSRAAERMFTSKHAVNSGQISNRFMLVSLSLSLPRSPTLTDTQSPPPMGATGVGSDGYEMSSNWMRVSTLIWTPLLGRRPQCAQHSVFVSLYRISSSPLFSHLFFPLGFVTGLIMIKSYFDLQTISVFLYAVLFLMCGCMKEKKHISTNINCWSFSHPSRSISVP